MRQVGTRANVESIAMRASYIIAPKRSILDSVALSIEKVGWAFTQTGYLQKELRKQPFSAVIVRQD
jgi:hypothetical protein